jgi:hypothetical protein
MVSHLISSTFLLLFMILIIDVSSVSASMDHHIIPRARHQQLANRLPRAVEQPAPPKRLRRRNSCNRPPKTNTSTSAAKPPSTPPPKVNQNTTTVPSPNSSSSSSSPSGLLTVTRTASAATRTSAADPYLLSLSQPVDNSANPWFTEVHNGDMTY